MKTLTLRKQLLIFVLTIATGFIAVAAFVGHGLYGLANELKSIGDSTEKNMGQIYSFLEECASIQTKVQVILNTKDPDQIEKQMDELTAIQKLVENQLKDCGAKCQAISTNFDLFIKSSTKTIEIYLSGNSADAFASLASDVAPIFNSLQKDLRSFSEDVTKSTRDRNQDASSSAYVRVFVTVTICLLVSALILAGGLLFRKKLVTRLDASVNVLSLIGNGDFDQRLEEEPADELGTMGSVINGMAAKIGSLLKSIEEKNKELTALNAGLEDKVAERTKAIRTILDHVTFGLLICDEKLNVKEGYSTSVNEIIELEGPLVGRSLADLLKLDRRNGENFGLLYNQIFDPDFLLGDLSVDQLPTRFQLADKTLGLTGSVVHDERGRANGVLFCLADISSLAKAEEEVERNRSLVKMISNRDSFRQFAGDAKNCFDRIYKTLEESGPQAHVRHELHTLKGNFGVFGLLGLASEIHNVEDFGEITQREVRTIEEHFEHFMSSNVTLLGVRYGEKQEDTYTIPASLIQTVEDRVNQIGNSGEARDIFVQFFQQIRMKQVRTILGPIQESLENLATRLGKSVTLNLSGETTLVPSKISGIFKVLSHLVRNSLDHGIEMPDERGEKPVVASINLNVGVKDNLLKIVLSDDGRGIAADKLLKKAVERNLVTNDQAKKMSERDKLNLIFLNGLSTSSDVTEISGRGVGMSAVKAAIDEAGGTIEIQSDVGKGTTFIMTIPTNVGSARTKGVA